MAETAEEISKRPEIRKELQRATGEKRPETVRARGRDKVWFIIQAVALLGCVAVYFLVGSKLIPLPQASAGVVVRIVRGIALIVILLAIARVISVYALGRIEDSSTRFTLQRVMHLVVALVIVSYLHIHHFRQLVWSTCRTAVLAQLSSASLYKRR